jgi:hypothetical protein
MLMMCQMFITATAGGQSTIAKRIGILLSSSQAPTLPMSALEWSAWY